MGSIHNGGISVTIGGTSVSTVSAYSVSTHRGGTATYKDISITTGVLSQADAQTLLGKAQNATVSVTCPDFSGTMYLTSASLELASANQAGKYCRITMVLTSEPQQIGKILTISAGDVSFVVSNYSVSYDEVGTASISAESVLVSKNLAQSALGLHMDEGTTGYPQTVTVTCELFSGNMYVQSVSAAYSETGKNYDPAGGSSAGECFYKISLSLSTRKPDGYITVNNISVGVTAYQEDWTYESESFEMWDYTTYNVYKGRRASVSYTTVPLTASASETLVGQFNHEYVTMTCGIFNAVNMYVNSVSRSVSDKTDSGGGEMYTFSVSCTAVALEGGS